MRKKHIEKEWQQLLKQEENFLNRNVKVKQSNWQEKIDRFMPEKLSDTLNAAFFKAFEMIFDKGTGIIEKTYQKEKKEQDYKINEYTAEVRGSRRALKAFGRKAKASKNFNMAVSTVEGIGMGVLGMGLPDIPVFLGVLLRSIYEIAVSYGFSYDTEEEQIFYDLCSYTVFDYAKTNEYSRINDIEGYFSADGTKLYLEVVFRAPWSKYFEINVNDSTDYSVSYEPFDAEGLENALSDYYYVIEEFDNKF